MNTTSTIVHAPDSTAQGASPHAATLAEITGIHHITAIARDPQRTMDFYTKVLGLRLVKLTVNFDDPGTYHYYFANATGEPGTVLTFFPWPTALRGRQGVGSVAATAFHIAPGALQFWHDRLSSHGVAVTRSTRLGETVLSFQDPDAMGLELVASEGGVQPGNIESSDVPAEMALRGFHSATLSLRDVQPTLALLRDVMGFRVIASEGPRTRLQAPGSAHHARIVDLLEQPDVPFHKLGAGIVHHIAFRMRDGAAQRAWQDAIRAAGLRVTDVADRDYFQSIYFREQGGVLFEFATDQPGFAIDEPASALGHALMLPTQYEPVRERLQRMLPRVTLPSGAVVGGGA